MTTTIRAAFLKPGMKIKGAGTVIAVRTYTISGDGEFEPYASTIIEFDRKVLVPGRGALNSQYQCDPDEQFTVEEPA